MGDATVLDEWPLVGRDAELDVVIGCLAERGAVVALLAAALGADVDATTAFALWRLSRGNVMHLRELVRGGRASGALAEGRRHRPGGGAGLPRGGEGQTGPAVTRREHLRRRT